MHIVTAEVIYFSWITALIFLSLWESRTPLFGFLPLISMLYIFKIQVGVLIYESKSELDIYETPEIFYLGIPEILGRKVSAEIYFLCILTNYLQSGCDGTILLYSWPVISTVKTILLHPGI